MGSNRRKINRTTKEDDGGIDQVEELLKATEDQLLLNLSVGSHMSKVAPSYIDSDLNRRFQALRKPSPASTSSSSSKSTKPIAEKPIPAVIDEKEDDGDDLLARFAALKGSRHAGAVSADLGSEGDSEEEDEVEKIIRWAKDAARLDPSPPTDSDDSDNFKPSEEEEDDEDSEDEVVLAQEKKSGRYKMKKKQTGKKGGPLC